MTIHKLGLIAKKVGMTQLFMDDGLRVPVTVLLVEPNRIVQKKTLENDGYVAIQVGTGERTPKNVNKPLRGHFAKANVPPQRLLREFRVTAEQAATLHVGETLGLDHIKAAKSLDITGISKGRGTAGVMKRHHMAGFCASHGTHEYFRHGGSIGCRAIPGKVHPGKRMPGRMGNETVTVLNVSLVKVDDAKGLLFVRGAVPGARGGFVELFPSAHTPQKGRRMTQEAQVQSKNPMKASKASTGGGAKGSAPKKK